MQKYIYLWLVLALPLWGTGQDLVPAVLRCEYRGTPLGMDEPHPRLSWELGGFAVDQYQSAYRILIAGTSKALERGLGDWWDSGKITDSENINIVPGGVPLQPFTRYYWKVMVWDQHGRPTAWSASSWFETGMLDSANWRGKWISGNKPLPATEADFYKDAPAPLFRKTFTVARKVRSARLYISGLGYNEASMNGRKIDDAVLDPAWTDYGHTVFYTVYDVARMLHPGKNVIGVLLGNGWYNPLPLRLWGRLNLREALTVGRPRVLANLRITYTDGSVETIATDESWKTTGSAILQNNVFLGEKIDGRLERKDWCLPATDDRDWPASVAADAPGGRLIASMMPPIRVKRSFHVVEITEPEQHVFVADLGQNFAGRIWMRVHGRAGQEIHFRYGEILQANGRVNGLTTVAGQIKEMWHVNGGPGAPPTAYQEDVYLCKGNDSDAFEPRFTFHGFRYVEVTGLTARPSPDDLIGFGLNTDVPTAGQIVTLDTLVNGIQRMVENTFLSNLFSVQSDCPGREKQGYGGDIVATADAFMYNYDMSGFYAKTLGDFADAVRPNGGMTECAPYNGIADEGLGGGTGPIGWQLAFPFLQRELYRFYGNRRIVEEQYGKTVGLVEFLRSQAKDGLIDQGIGDHEAVNPKHVPLTSGAFYYGHAQLLSELAGLLGKKEESLRWRALADSIKVTFNARYLQEDGARYDTGANQTTQVFPLWWKLATNPGKSFGELVRLVDVVGNGHLSTGIFGTKMLFDVLRRFGRNDLAYRMMSQRDFPGYAYMRDHGATTLIESWGLTDQNSWNHPMFGSVSEWFYRGLAGINPADDAYGMDKLVLRPYFDKKLGAVVANYHSIRGKIASEWKWENGAFYWSVLIPPNTRAEVYLPAGIDDRVMVDGQVPAKEGWTEGYYPMAIVSGLHQFRVEPMGRSLKD